jgi:transcriptional regulator with XRE-family HTH domain
LEEKIFLQKIGKRIKEVRESKGLSQQELAAKLDYEKSNMSRLESGRVNPRITTLKHVAEALEVPIMELVSI